MSPTTSTTPRWLIYPEIALILIAPFVYWRMPHEISSDGFFRLETTRYLALGTVIDQPVPMFMSIAALPLYHFGDIVAEFNVFIFFGGLALLALLLWTRVPMDILRRAILILIAASMFGHHTQLFFGELLTAMMIAVGIAFLLINQRALAYLFLIGGVINMPATAPALFLMLVMYETGRYRFVKAGWPIVVCALLMMLEFYLRRGDPFSTGYEGDQGQKSIMPYSGLPGFSYPFMFGVLSILFSFGKGLALYAPGLWLMLARTVSGIPATLRRFQRASIWFLAGLVLVYAKWWAWPGGWFWGPRFFVFASIPASIALAIHLCDRRASHTVKAIVLAVLAWSVWVGIDGNVYGQLEMGMCNAQPDVEPLCWYSPEYSALFRPFIVAKTLSTSEQLVFGYSLVAGIILAIPFAIDLVNAAIQRVTQLRDRPALP